MMNVEQSQATAEADVAAAKSELRKLDQQEARLTRLTVQGVLSEKAGTAQLRELQANRHEWQRAVAGAQARVRDVKAREESRQDLREIIGRVRADMESMDPEEGRRAVLWLFHPGGGVVLRPDGTLQVEGAVQTRSPAS